MRIKMTELTYAEHIKIIDASQDQYRKDISNAVESFKREMTAACVELHDALVAEYKQPVRIYWYQYTPYFNDGDECRFRVNDLEVKIDGNWVDVDAKFDDLFRKADKLLFANREVNLRAYGDHVRVDLWEGKLVADEVDHD